MPFAVQLEEAAQKNFSEQKQRIFVPSSEHTDTQTRLTEFCRKPEDGGQILLLTGAHGSGKSALLADWLTGYRKGLKGHDMQDVHSHHVGASMLGSDITNFMMAVVDKMRSAYVGNGKILLCQF